MFSVRPIDQLLHTLNLQTETEMYIKFGITIFQTCVVSVMYININNYLIAHTHPFTLMNLDLQMIILKVVFQLLL